MDLRREEKRGAMPKEMHAEAVPLETMPPNKQLAFDAHFGAHHIMPFRGVHKSQDFCQFLRDQWDKCGLLRWHPVYNKY